MTLRAAPPLLLALGAVSLAAGCGGSGGKTTASTPTATIPVLKVKARILTFSGPTTVACKKGKTVTVAYRYLTKNADSVEPEVDGQPVGASAGYPPHRGTMRFPYPCPGPHKLTIVAQNLRGPTVTRTAVVTSKSSPAAASPRILEFKGPSSVSCSKKGEIHGVGFQYRVTGAQAVEPEIDGQNPGAQAGYDPKQGTMNFNYVCPGPHTMTIAAFGKNGHSVSTSRQVVPSSAG